MLYSVKIMRNILWQSVYCTGLTRKNVLVAVFGLILWSLSLFPTVEMLRFLLLQFLCNGNEQKYYIYVAVVNQPLTTNFTE